MQDGVRNCLFGQQLLSPMKYIFSIYNTNKDAFCDLLKAKTYILVAYMIKYIVINYYSYYFWYGKK
jgi:hypothetical protein